MRTNQKHFIGIAEKEGRVKYSAHAIFKSDVEDLPALGKAWTVHCDFQKAFDGILKCLKNELDWLVLENVLKNLPYQLQNKSLFIFCHCNMNQLCAALYNLVNDKMYLNKVQNCPSTLGISELRNLIFPILSVIATFHNYLSRERQYDLVKCLEFGLSTLCVRTCVTCLTVCTLEMQHVMVKTLPPILVKLSQISATVTMAVPVLQFLSSKFYVNSCKSCCCYVVVIDYVSFSWLHGSDEEPFLVGKFWRCWVFMIFLKDFPVLLIRNFIIKGSI